MSDVAGAEGSSFDRMRTMLLRAAEIRDAEQSQIFRALDEITARLAALDALGTIRKRLADLPDGSALGSMGERVERALAMLAGVDSAVAGIPEEIRSVPERIGPALAAFAERFDAVTSRLDALTDRVDLISRRLEEVGNGVAQARMELAESAEEQRRGLAAMRGELGETVSTSLSTSLMGPLSDAVAGTVAEQVAAVERLGRAQTAETTQALEQLRATVTDAIAGLGERLAERTTQDTERRLGEQRAEFDEQLTRVVAGLNKRIDRLSSQVLARPDSGTVSKELRERTDEMARLQREALDEAMATFAELTVVTPSRVALPNARTSSEQQAETRARRSRAADRRANGRTTEHD